MIPDLRMQKDQGIRKAADSINSVPARIIVGGIFARCVYKTNTCVHARRTSG
jgi:hypothetical protein